MAGVVETPQGSIELKFTGKASPKGKAASTLDPAKEVTTPPPPPPTPELRPAPAPAAPQPAPTQPAPAAPQQPPAQPQQAVPQQQPAPAQPAAQPAAQPQQAPTQQKQVAPQIGDANDPFKAAYAQQQQETAQAGTDASVQMAPADPAHGFPDAEPLRIRQMKIDIQKQQAEEAKQIDALNPPVEFPLLKAGFQLGGYLGVSALGGGPEDVPAGIVGAMGGTQAYNALQNIWDALTGTKNSQGQPVTATQETMDALKTGLLTAGGSVGGAIGKSGLARVGMGALGTATGTYTADQIAAIGKFWNIIPPEERTPDNLEAVKDAVINGGLDVLINTALSRPMKSAMVSFSKWALGFGPNEVQATLLAAKYGIHLTANNLSDTTIANMYRNVVTRLVPFLASPFKKRFREQLRESHAAVGGMPEQVARGPVPTSGQIGQDSIAAANGALDSALDALDDRYNRLLVQSHAAGASFNIEYSGLNQDGIRVPSLKAWARSVLASVKKAAPYGKKGVVPKNELTKLANDILAMKQYAYPEELNAFGGRMDQIFASGSNSDRDLIKQGRDSLFGSYEDSKSLTSKSRDFGWEFQQVAKQSAEVRRIFDTPAGQKLGSAGIRTGRAPTRVTMSPDVAGDAMFNMTDPAQVRELRKRIGDDLMNQGAAYFLQKKISDSTKNGLFNPEAFSKAVGLDNPASPGYQALKEALRTSDVTIDDVTNIINAFRQAMKNAPEDPSAMVARAAMLGGGPKGILKYIFPVGILEHGKGIFGELSKNPIKSSAITLGLLLMGKKFSKIMSNPTYIQDALTFLNTNAGNSERRMAWGRLVRAIYHDEIFGYRTGEGLGSARQRASETGADEGSPFLRSAPPPALMQNEPQY